MVVLFPLVTTYISVNIARITRLIIVGTLIKSPVRRLLTRQPRAYLNRELERFITITCRPILFPGPSMVTTPREARPGKRKLLNLPHTRNLKISGINV